MEFNIPGAGTLHITDILLDYNGTLAIDGTLIQGVGTILNDLSCNFAIHIITADTFGSAESELIGVKCRFIRILPGNQSEAKLQHLINLGKNNTACIGNGRNDRLMLKESVLGISVIQGEGLFTETMLASDVVCPDIFSALAFFQKPGRLLATMRD